MPSLTLDFIIWAHWGPVEKGEFRRNPEPGQEATAAGGGLPAEGPGEESGPCPFTAMTWNLAWLQTTRGQSEQWDSQGRGQREAV